MMIQRNNIYTKPTIELFKIDRPTFVLASFGGSNESAVDGGTYGDAKISFSWTFQDREHMDSIMLNNSWE